MSKQKLKVDTRLRIARSPHEVYEAIVDPDKMSRYFISSGSGRLDAGKTVTWKWADYGVECVVRPGEIDPVRRVCFSWSASNTEASVEFTLKPDGEDATVVRVTETGWPTDAEGMARCLQQTQGWVNMLCCMKAWLEYGINLRSGGVVK
jgi:uncharacterized protein YndB with AHSA1/START domain